MVARPQTALSPEEYLASERAAETKHEYYDGEIVAMVGASRNHNLIAGNTFASLHRQFRQRPCDVYWGDMRVRVGSVRIYTYPDVTAVCGEPHFADDQADTLLNPMVIVEVLSPSTESYDRGEKFPRYRTLNSLREYILIAQDASLVEHFIRQTDDYWLLSTVSGLDATLHLPSIECELALRDIYEKVAVAEG